MWPNPQFPADLITFTEESLIEIFIFCAVKDVKEVEDWEEQVENLKWWESGIFLDILKKLFVKNKKLG